MKKVFKQNILNIFHIILYKQLFLGVIHGDLNVNNIIMKDNKIHGIIDLGDVLYSFTIFDFAIALCYLILHEFKDNNKSLFDVQFKNFFDAYEKQYRPLNDLELSVVHVS